MKDKKVKIKFRFLRADSFELLIDGKVVNLTSEKDAAFFKGFPELLPVFKSWLEASEFSLESEETPDKDWLHTLLLDFCDNYSQEAEYDCE